MKIGNDSFSEIHITKAFKAPGNLPEPAKTTKDGEIESRIHERECVHTFLGTILYFGNFNYIYLPKKVFF